MRYLGQIGSILGVTLVGTVVNQSLSAAGKQTVDTLTIALQHGFLTVLLFCIAALLATCFLKDARLPTGRGPIASRPIDPGE